MLMDTVSSMQGAVNRLERYVESVQNLETIQEIDCHKKNSKYEETAARSSKQCAADGNQERNSGFGQLH